MVVPDERWQFHAAGTRMALKPAAFTALIKVCVVAGLPHAVSPHWASSVLPRFQPVLIPPATVCAAGSWACDGAEMDATSSAQSASPLRHFAAEGLRSDMNPPEVLINP